MTVLGGPIHGSRGAPLYPGLVQHLEDLEVAVIGHPVHDVAVRGAPLRAVSQQPPHHIRVAGLDSVIASTNDDNKRRGTRSEM